MHDIQCAVENSYVRFFDWEGTRQGGKLYMRKADGKSGWTPARQSDITGRIETCIRQLEKRGDAASIQLVTLNCRDGVRLCLTWALIPEDAATMTITRRYVTMHNVYFHDFLVAVRIEKGGGPLLTVGDRNGRVSVTN